MIPIKVPPTMDAPATFAARMYLDCDWQSVSMCVCVRVCVCVCAYLDCD